MGWAIVDRAAQPPRLTEDVIRDEQVQVEYLAETLGILEEERVEGAFWFTFASYTYPWNSNPRHDLDCAAYGVVKDAGWRDRRAVSRHALGAKTGVLRARRTLCTVRLALVISSQDWQCRADPRQDEL